jgi:HD-GYP domain-containing protein (c-di-GMP phosphodiesterase class II)
VPHDLGAALAIRALDEHWCGKGYPLGLRGEEIPLLARGFADVIDAKSPYTFRHSSNVAEYARGVAEAVGLGAAEARRLHRAGMLHDIGKLGVSSEILDAPRRLTDDERLAVVDIYEALTADRPSRAGMSHAAALDLLWRDRGTALCPTALDGLAAWAEGAGRPAASVSPCGAGARRRRRGAPARRP